MADGDETSAKSPVERRVSSVLLAAFLTFAAAFIVSSTWQLEQAVYGPPRAIGGSPDAVTCRAGIEKLRTALERSFAASRATEPGADGIAAFGAGLAPEWNELDAVKGACSRAEGGDDALAALLRLRVAEETALRRETAEIGPLRRAVRESAR